MADSKGRPWYADGLRFECQAECGGCCVNHGQYAYVYLEHDDADRLARRLGLTRRQFLRRYTELDDGHRVLRMDRPVCPFLDGTRCTVYLDRPIQCKTFPFWADNLRRPSDWKRLGRFCPGIGKGKRNSLAVIRRHIAAREA